MTDARRAVVRRLVRADPEAVFDQWVDPHGLSAWMCPRPARCLSVEVDARVGGHLRFDIEEDGVRFIVTGRYLTLDRPVCLAFTWSCSTWPDPSLETTVTVALAPSGAGHTLMTIEHSMLPPSLTGRHAAGWRTVADQLDAALAIPAIPDR